MLTELKKSINSVLYERTRSPLYGTFIISWAIWNWRIIYLTVFIAQDKIEGTKIEYITQHYFDSHYLLIYPLISTLILLTVIPFASNGAYWLTTKFKKWRIDQRNSIEQKQLLTIEQSISLREQIYEQETKLEKLLSNKNSEIKQLEALVEELRKTKIITNTTSSSSKNIIDTELTELADRIKNNRNLLNEYKKTIQYVQSSYRMTGQAAPTTDTLSLLESHDIITNTGNATYKLTETGKKFQKLMTKD